MDNIGKIGLTIPNEFAIGQSVYACNDRSQNELLVNAIKITPHGLIYEASDGRDVLAFYEFQLRGEKDLVNALT